MTRRLKPGDVVKINKQFDRLISLKDALKILSDEGPVGITVRDVMGGSAGFMMKHGTAERMNLCMTVEKLIKEEKSSIRRKYEIDIK